MKKNWLIRTKNNHILGPISKQKLIELYHSGSMREDDEICSGNGFWFLVKETDFVRKYIESDEEQCFNPVSEIGVVLDDSGSFIGSDSNENVKNDITAVLSLDQVQDALKEEDE